MKCKSKHSINGSFEFYSSRNIHGQSFMAVALVVLWKLTETQKLDKNLQSPSTVKCTSRLNIDDGFKINLLRCMHESSYKALALIVLEKMT